MEVSEGIGFVFLYFMEILFFEAILAIERLRSYDTWLFVCYLFLVICLFMERLKTEQRSKNAA